MRTISFNQFNGGMVNDPRDTRPNVCRVCTNFDALTNPFRLAPYYDSESGDSSASTSKKQNFCIALHSGTTYYLYSLGVVSGSGKAEILSKALSTGGSQDLGDATWATPANNQSASGTTNFELFVYYQTTGTIYGAKGGSALWGFDPSGSAAFSEDIISTETSGSMSGLTYTNITQGLVHSKDDILYIPYDNKIATNNNKTWNKAALTLPAKYYITAICEYGNYLAIACAPISQVGNSVVYLWDRNSSLTTISESIDWGEGIIKVLNQIEGYLVGISVTNSSVRVTNRVIFRYYSSTLGAVKFEELLSTATTNLYQRRQLYNNRLFFMMSTTLNGEVKEGLWSVGRSGTGFSIFHERTPNNDTALGAGSLWGFFIVGDYAFISYVDNAGDYQLSKTNNTSSHTATSIYETVINPDQPERYRNSAGMRSNKKKLVAGLLMTEPLPAGAVVTVYYKVDGGSWTEWGANSTTGSVFLELSNFDASGNAVTDGREFEFKFTSTGGAVLTEFKYKLDINETLL